MGVVGGWVVSLTSIVCFFSSICVLFVWFFACKRNKLFTKRIPCVKLFSVIMTLCRGLCISKEGFPLLHIFTIIIIIIIVSITKCSNMIGC